MANKNIQLLSLNVRGLRDNMKRRNIFQWLKDKNPDIVFLQETHCHLKKDENQWSKEWSGAKTYNYWSLGTSRSKGVAILLSKNLCERNITVTNVVIDPNGRSIKLIIQINDRKYRFINIYAPNNEAERVNFFVNMQSLFNDNVDAETILGGDFNCTMNSINDRQNCSVKNDVGQIDLHHLSNSFDLEDIWRRRYPNEKEYSWNGRGRMSRIDFWLTSLSLNNQIDDVYHCYAPYTDHKSINIIIRTEEISQGKGIWKMNTSNILKEEFRQDFTEMWKQWQIKKSNYHDIRIWWDIGKRRIKNLTQEFSKKVNINKRLKLDELETKINQLQNSGDDANELTKLQKEYETIHQKNIEGARIRSRVKWWEEGERSSKFFHSLEKRNGKNKNWDKVLDSEGNLVFGTNNVQKRQVHFYKDLYTSQPLQNGDTGFFLDNIDSQLTQTSKQYMDSVVAKDEISKAIKKMTNNKSPGEDGIPVEFYKVYWNVISDDLLEVLHVGLDNGQLAYTQYLAVIILLYKKGSRADIKNWRPISLLNVDYKILSKALAERLKTVLPEIIHVDQRGCVPGRYIGENIRLIDDLLFEIENQDDDNPVILMLDQEKAFDRVEWDWLFETLEGYNFGETFITWLKTLYKDSKSCILTNGVQSEYFEISRGIRQGDSLSALLYIIQFEPLAQKLRTSNSIEGISINLHNCEDENLTVRGCQYVDDSNTMLKSTNDISNFLDIINSYENVSGSKVNLHKTVGLVIQESMAGVLNGLKLTTGPERVLGVPLGKDSNKSFLFWETLIKKMKSRLDFWRIRDLSLEGKTHLIRSIAISQTLYAIEMLHIDPQHIKSINDILWDFLWSGKRYSISKNICTLPRSMGGLGLADLNTLVKVKRVRWVIRMLKDNTSQNWSKLIENYLRCLDNKFGVTFFSLKVTDSSGIIATENIPSFYKECIKCFQELCRKGKSTKHDEIIWLNHAYQFNGKPLNYTHWSKSGIITKSHLYKNGVIDKNGIYAKLKHKAGFLFEMRTVKKVMPESLAHAVEDVSVITDDKDDILQYQLVVPGQGIKCLKDLSPKEIYNIFLLSQCPDIKSKQYWCNKFNLHDIDWDALFIQNLNNKLLPRKCKDFNWKLFHGLVNTESRLKRMKYSDGLCRLCKTGEVENMDHLMMGCSYNLVIWKLLETVIHMSFGYFYKIDLFEIMLGFLSAEDVQSPSDILIINVLIGICRYHIWKKRNCIRYGAENISFNQSVKSLKIDLETHFQTLLFSDGTCQTTKKKLENTLLNLKQVL